MKILWHSNAIWVNSGYGTQSKHVCNMLVNQGHDVIMSNFAGMFGTVMETPVPGTDKTYHVVGHGERGSWGNEVIDGHVATFKPDWVFSLIDHFVLKDWGPKKNFNWVPWIPLDCNHPMPQIHRNSLQNAYHLLPYSRYSEDMLKRWFNPNLVTYIPHSIDTSKYAPRDQRDCRAKLHCPQDVFIFGATMANIGYPNRKGMTETIAAFRLCLDAGMDDIMLFLHTSLSGDVDINQFAGNLNIPAERLILPDQYKMTVGMMQDDHMVDTFNSFDVCMAPARGEGFGLPILEAQCCGIPVVTTDHSSMSELTFTPEGMTSWCLTPKSHSGDFKNALMANPDPEDIAQAMWDAYHEKKCNPEAWQKRAVEARKGAGEYDHGVVYPKYWYPYLGTLSDDLRLFKSKRWDMGLKIPGEGMIP